MTRPLGGGAADYDYIFKLVLIGDSSVGKSNLLLRFTRNEFRLDTQSTIGVEFAYKQVIIDGKKIKTQVWDTAGQERFKTVIPQFYRGSEGALAVFDLTKHDSFDHISSWIEEVHRHTPADLPIVLIGNKSDLVSERHVTREEATALAEQLNLSYIETSALNATNVEQAFTLLVKNIYQRKTPKTIASSQTSETSPPTVSIDPTSTRTVSVSYSSTSKTDKAIRPSFKESTTTTAKKNGCCVVS